ncbi:fascin domain-containing protein [Streptomyces sp. NPDC088387]|uniref:fascin domain-containing protein n=1 Tax=Streptomyces sp. NPDC088387 TaxID=3365859 RepID=UPI003822E844
MRRTTSALLTLSALLAATAVTAPMAVAAPQADQLVGVPSGWEAVDGDVLNQAAEKNNSRAAVAAEPELVALQSAKNSKFVATEKTYAAPNTGVLRARSAAYNGSWEGFAFEWDEATETYSIRSLANNLYVAVEKNFTGNAKNELRARSASVGGWERFIVYYNSDLDRYALQSTLNNQFVAMENGITGTHQYALRARSAEISGSWEEFNLFTLEA